MSEWSSLSITLLATLTAVATVACSDPRCPDGYTKVRDVCRHSDASVDTDASAFDPELDAGQGNTSGDSDTTTAEGSAMRSDGASVEDARTTNSEAGAASTDASGAARDATTEADGAGVANDAALFDGGSADPRGDAATGCATGYVLSNGSCQDVDECTSPNSCTITAYPCTQTAAPGYICQGQFADWHMPDAVPGSKFTPSYDVATTPGAVIDNVTGLVWQRTIDVGTYTWDAAKTYCDTLTWAGQGDWRLPSEIELASIVDETKPSPNIDADAFPSAPAAGFWSASPYVGASENSWAVLGAFAQTFANSMAFRVRCVRSGRALAGTPATRYVVDTASAAVTDTRTGLVWQMAVNMASYTLSDAKTYCSTLSGWRLPALKELLTLVDLTRGSPSIDPTFANTPPVLFWSASPYNATSDRAWTVNFVSGLSTSDDVATPNRVRCVR